MVKRRDAIADVMGDDSPMETMGEEDNSLASLAGTANARPRNREAEKKSKPGDRANNSKKPANDKPAKNTPPRKSVRKSTAEPLERLKRMMVSIEEERTIDELVARIGREVGTKVQFSQVGRAMWSMLLEAETGLDKVRPPSLRRPENGNLEALAEFEAALAEYLFEVFLAAKRQHR